VAVAGRDIIVCKFGFGYDQMVCFCEEDICFERTQDRKWGADWMSSEKGWEAC